MNIPRRQTISPRNFAEREDDAAAWRRFGQALRKTAMAAGMRASLRSEGSASASWYTVRFVLFRYDAAELREDTEGRDADGAAFTRPRVEVIPVADGRILTNPRPGVPADWEPDPAGCLVRQIDAWKTGHSGPNHSVGLRTDLDVVTLALLLTARPFDRDRCGHCVQPSPSAGTPPRDLAIDPEAAYPSMPDPVSGVAWDRRRGEASHVYVARQDPGQRNASSVTPWYATGSKLPDFGAGVLADPGDMTREERKARLDWPEMDPATFARVELDVVTTGEGEVRE